MTITASVRIPIAACAGLRASSVHLVRGASSFVGSGVLHNGPASGEHAFERPARRGAHQKYPAAVVVWKEEKKSFEATAYYCHHAGGRHSEIAQVNVFLAIWMFFVGRVAVVFS